MMVDVRLMCYVNDIFIGLHSPLHHCDEFLGHLLAGEDGERPRDSCQVDQEFLEGCNDFISLQQDCQQVAKKLRMLTLNTPSCYMVGIMLTIS